MLDIVQNFRFALRALYRTPTVTLVAAGSLALAIAGNTTLFSQISVLLFKPPAFADLENLVILSERDRAMPEHHNFFASASNYRDWCETATSFAGCPTAARFRPMAIEYGDSAELLRAGAVSGNLFDVLGVSPLRGRLIQPADATSGAAKVVVLTFELWRDRFEQRPEFLGSRLRLNGEPHEVIGILPKGFDLLGGNAQFLVPLLLEEGGPRLADRDLAVYARLAPGVEIAAAQAEIDAIMADLEQRYPSTNRDVLGEVRSMANGITNRATWSLLILFQSALLFVLLIACFNIANILLARSHGRERELAVRTSLGAGRRGLIRQLMFESMVLSSGGAVVGLLLGAAGIRALEVFVLHRVRHPQGPEVDLPVLAFTAILTIFSALVFGLAPAIHSTRFNVVAALKENSRSMSAGRRQRRLTAALVVAELTVALLCLGGAAVMLRSFHALRAANPGFETDGLMTTPLNLPESWGEDEKLLARVDDLTARLATTAGVDSLAISDLPPRTLVIQPYAFAIDQAPDQVLAPQAYRLFVDPSFFETTGIELRRGRLLTSADRGDSPPVAVISDATARRYWGDEDPIGQRITVQELSHEIVGIVGNARHGLAVKKEEPASIYLPWAQSPTRQIYLTLRVSAPPTTIVPEFRRAMEGFDPVLASAPLETLETFLDQYYVNIELFELTLAAVAALSLLLAALGTYGVMAYSVTLRTHEIGVRLAMGARRSEILRMVTLYGVRLTLIGLVIALPLFWALMKVISSMLADSMPVEPAFGAWVLVAMTLVAVGASLVPALRASKVDPVKTLHCE